MALPERSIAGNDANIPAITLLDQNYASGNPPAGKVRLAYDEDGGPEANQALLIVNSSGAIHRIPVGIINAQPLIARSPYIKVDRYGRVTEASSGGLVAMMDGEDEVTNTVSESTLFGNSTLGVLAFTDDTELANELVAGSAIRNLITGIYSTHATNQEFEIQVYLGGNLILTTGAISPSGGAVDSLFRLEINLAVLTAGVSGTVNASGLLYMADSTEFFPLLNTGSETVDTTDDPDYDVTITYTNAESDNKFRSQVAFVEHLRV